MPLILRPTRITEHTATLIDNIFTNDIENIESSTNGIIFSDISDHLPIVHVRNSKIHLETTRTAEFICKRIIKDSNIQSFTNEIKCISWENVLSNNNSAESYNEFFDLFSNVYEKNFPLTKKVFKKKLTKIKAHAWMTKCIAKSVKKKNTLYKKYLCHPTTNNEDKYKRYKKN
jgi:hypothetical protein